MNQRQERLHHKNPIKELSHSIGCEGLLKVKTDSNGDTER